MLYSILFLYYLLSFIYILVMYVRTPKNTIMRFILLFFCPFIGIFIIYFLEQRNSPKYENLPDWLIVKLKELDEKPLNVGDVEKERNVVSIQEAMVINNHKTRRKMLLDLLKRESIQQVDALEIALQNDDSETSHYAASAILETKRKIFNHMQKLERDLQDNPNDIELLTSYADVLEQYIKIEFLDKNTRLKYTHYYSQTLEKLLKVQTKDETLYLKKINCDLSLQEYSKAGYYANQFIERFPTSEHAHLTLMKLYYMMKDYEALKNSMDRLQASSVALSPTGLNLLRFWLRGENR
ncbi:hypothetical protein LCL95_14520 [Bacillus timonensis]|nr:hypothetical protein [Bacillus timonensis]